MPKRVVIVGGGVIGACCAHELNRAGHSVTLLDAGPIGRGCSFGNSGFIAPGHGPLCRPGAYERAINSQHDPDSPWYYSDASEHTRRWMDLFQTFCTHEHEAHCLRVLDELGRDMVARYESLLDETGIECDFHARGSESVAYEQDSVIELETETASMRARGFKTHTSMPRDDSLAADALEPGWKCAQILPDGASLNPYRFVCGLVESLRPSIEIREHTSLSRIITNQGTCVGIELDDASEISTDALVLATGMSSAHLSAPLGIDLPLQPAKGYHVDVELPELPIKMPIIIADSDTILTPIDNFIRISGTVELTDADDSLKDRRIEALYQRGLRALPALQKGRVISRWLGRRPALPDGLPAIGSVPGVDNLIIATGHARLGMSLAPGTAKLVRELIGGKHNPIEEHLGIDRFLKAQID
jgi:D-amino-acid dehydrogenase